MDNRQAEVDEDFGQGAVAELGLKETIAEKLQRLEEKADVAQEELLALLYNCEMLEHIEWRTSMANHKRQGAMTTLKAKRDKLHSEAAEIHELHDEASQSKNAADRELAAAKNAMLDRQRAYEECKQSRASVIQEQKQLRDRQEKNMKAEADAKMDGQGDLDAEGEQRLRDKAKDISRLTVQDQLQKEHSGQRESTLEAQYNRLRQASHNPQDIETPQDMMIAMLSVKGDARPLMTLDALDALDALDDLDDHQG